MQEAGRTHHKQEERKRYVEGDSDRDEDGTERCGKYLTQACRGGGYVSACSVYLIRENK
jgi:hypothetical protein